MSRLFSLSDLNKKKEEEEKKRDEYYAGGNDSRTGGGSGLSIVDPQDRRGGSEAGDALSRIVENARNGGARSDGESPVPTGRRITLYRNGFTVDDGPLRDLESPESKRFLEALAAGYVPNELISDNKAKDVAIELSDKRGEDYVPPPPPPYVAFGGEAMSLGRSSSSTSSGIITPDLISTENVLINESLPITTLQVRLLSGKKVRIRINQSQTILHLIALINREEAITRPFILSAGFPPKDVSNFDQSITDAQLVGASVTLKDV